jgi:hypothetical protein
MSILMQLIQSDGLGDWREINEAGPKYQAVTAQDIQRVARVYFTKENRNVAIYTRKVAKSPGEENGTEKLTPDEKSALEKYTAEVNKETNFKKLRAELTTVNDEIGEADEKTKPMLEAKRKALEQRLKDLRK